MPGITVLFPWFLPHLFITIDLAGTEDLRVPVESRPPGKETKVAGIGSARGWFVPEFLCEKYRATLHKRPAYGVRGCMVLAQEISKGSFPDIADGDPLAYLEVAVCVHVQTFRLLEIFIRATGKLPPVMQRCEPG